MVPIALNGRSGTYMSPKLPGGFLMARSDSGSPEASSEPRDSFGYYLGAQGTDPILRGVTPDHQPASPEGRSARSMQAPVKPKETPFPNPTSKLAHPNAGDLRFL